MQLLRRLRRGLIFLGCFFVVAVLGYHFITGKGWLDSIYFFVITVSTVGYGETSTASPAMQLWTIAVIVIGVFAATYTLGLTVQMMVEGQILRAMGIRRMNRDIKALTDHTIICGFGRIGRTLSEELTRKKKPFVIIDSDHEVVATATDEQHLVVTGDATDEETLIEAGIERASTLVVALHGDAENVFLTLTARNLNQSLKIIARGEQIATEQKLKQAGADRVVLPAVIGARRMAALVTRPNAADMLDHFTNHTNVAVELGELSITEGSSLAGQSVKQAAPKQKFQLLVIGIRRADGEFVFNPSADTDFRVGDTVVVMGNQDNVQAFEERCHENDASGN